MARKSEPLKVRCFLSTSGRDGPYKPIEECSEEEIEMFRSKTSENLSELFSEYYSARPDEFIKLAERFNRNSA